jgi:tetratricopeptide (TPR) repeat protein
MISLQLLKLRWRRFASALSGYYLRPQNYRPILLSTFFKEGNNLFYLPVLRRLVYLQQFEELKNIALSTHRQTLDPHLLPLIAIAHLQLDDYVLAMSFVHQAEVALVELDAEARVDLAAVYTLMHRVKDSKELLDAALTILPAHPLALARLGWCEMQCGDPGSAKLHFEIAADLAPRRLPVWIALVRLSINAHQVAPAQTALNRLLQELELERDNMPTKTVDNFVAQLRCLQIEIWDLDDDRAQIESWLAERKTTVAEEPWVGLVNFYASLLARKNNYADAEKSLRDALKVLPKNISLLSQLAELAKVQGRTQLVIVLLRRCIYFNEKDQKPTISLWIQLSTSCLHGMEVQARQAAEKAVELVADLTLAGDLSEQAIQKQTWQARNALAQVENQAQNFDKASLLFNQNLDENPYFIDSLQCLASQKMQQGDIDGAITLFGRIKQIDPVSEFASLTNGRQFPEDVQTLESIEKISKQPRFLGQGAQGHFVPAGQCFGKA